MKSNVSITYGYPFWTVKIGFLENKIKKKHHTLLKVLQNKEQYLFRWNLMPNDKFEYNASAFSIITHRPTKYAKGSLVGTFHA